MATSQDVVLSTRDGNVVTWTINLPEARNPISGDDVIDRLVELAEEANRDIDTRVVILTGAGSAFSAGGNVKDMDERRGMFGGSPHALREATVTASSACPAPSTTARSRSSPRSTDRP